MIEKGVTYIADRGYIAFDLFAQLVDNSAFFIIRVKSNMDYATHENLTISLPDNWKGHPGNLTDSLVVFTGDSHKKTCRLVAFEALGETCRIATNRTNLATHQIIMFYACRWQIELFFRCIKRCFKGLHLWSQEKNGIEIQFYLYLIVYLLLLSFKQHTHEKSLEEEASQEIDPKTDRSVSILKTDKKPSNNRITRTPACGIVTLPGEKLKALWKTGIHWLEAVKNLLTSPFDREAISVLNSV